MRVALASHIPIDMDEMISLVVRGLAKMYDPDRGLFCFRLNLTENGIVREGYSYRYTIIALLGLRERERSGIASPIDVKSTLQHLLKDRSWIRYAGDVGLLLWLCAEAAPECMERICFSPDLKMALSCFADARNGYTRELAWLLSGLAHAVLARQEERADLTDLTAKVFSLIRGNQGESGIFGHSSSRRTLLGHIHSRVGSFSDQVYAIYALLRLAQAYDYDEPLEMAVKCAQAICALQGPLGQWWWQYDSQSGRVVQKYPVYSLHQSGLAPMALLALAQITKKDFTEPVERGMQWVTGRNELKYDLRSVEVPAIWRGIFKKTTLFRYAMEPLALFGLSADETPPHALSIKMECRPHHLGWLLYTFSRNPVAPPMDLGSAIT